jgi:hypothetical protein
MLAEALENSEGGDAMQAVAKWREAAMAGGQGTHGGGSQGAVFSVYQDLIHKRITQEEADIRLADAALEEQGAGVLSHQSMKSHDVDNTTKALRRRVAKAVATGDLDAVDREMAVANNFQMALTSASASKGTKFAKDFFLAEIDSGALAKVKGGPNAQGKTEDLDEVINVKVNQTRQIQRAVVHEEDDPNGFYKKGDAILDPNTKQPVMETVTVPVEVVEHRQKVTLQDLHDSRRGSKAYNAATKDYGGGSAAAEAARRAGGMPGPGQGPTPDQTPRLPI